MYFDCHLYLNHSINQTINLFSDIAVRKWCQNIIFVGVLAIMPIVSIHCKEIITTIGVGTTENHCLR